MRRRQRPSFVTYFKRSAPQECHTRVSQKNVIPGHFGLLCATKIFQIHRFSLLSPVLNTLDHNVKKDLRKILYSRRDLF